MNKNYTVVDLKTHLHLRREILNTHQCCVYVEVVKLSSSFVHKEEIN